MRNASKITTLENKFPLLAVEGGCIVSKDADVTVAFRVELPELFTATSQEYGTIHSTWNKAVRVLPHFSIVHKQDFFTEEKYRPDTGKKELSFLSEVSSDTLTKTLPESRVLPLPDENDQAADGATKQLLLAVQGKYPAQGD